MNFTICLLLSFSFPFPCVQQLGHKSFRQREASHKVLLNFGRFAIPALEKGANHPSCEVRRRCVNLLSRYAYEIAERDSYKIHPTNWPRLPWICEYHDWAGTGAGYISLQFLAEARTRIKPEADMSRPEWPEYREATRLWIRSQLIQKRPLPEIQRDLDSMVVEERGWIIQCGNNYKPAIVLPKGYE